MSDTIVVSAYCAISSVFMLMTALEGWAMRGGWTLARGFGPERRERVGLDQSERFQQFAELPVAGFEFLGNRN